MGEKGRSGRDAGDEDPLSCKSRKYGEGKRRTEREAALIRLETKAVNRFARGSTTLLALQHLMFGAEFQQNMDSLCSQCEGIGRTVAKIHLFKGPPPIILRVSGFEVSADKLF